MSPKDQLIERWTKSLDDNAEQQLHAMGMLHETIDSECADLEDKVKALAQVTPTKQKNRARSLLFCAGLAAILFLIIAWNTALLYPNLLKLVSFARLEIIDTDELIIRTPEETFLLYGDTTRTGKTNQIRALWEREPHNPVYYAEYARFYYKENNSLPTDFLKIAEQIDPDNGWFLYVSACELAKNTTDDSGMDSHPRSPISGEAYKKLSRGDQEKMVRQVVTQRRIIKPKQADQALKLWKQSLAKPKFNSYELDLHRKRYPILNSYSNLSQLLQSHYYTQSTFMSSEFSFHSLLVAMLQNEQPSDREIERLMRDIDRHLLRSINEAHDSLLRKYVMSSSFSIITQQIHVVNTDNIDLNLVDTWKKREASYNSYALKTRLARKGRSMEDSVGNEDWKQSALFTERMLIGLNYVLLEPIAPQPSELAPLRYAEHAFTMRLVAIFFSIIAMLFFPFNLAFRRRNPLLRLGAEVWPTIPWGSQVKLFFWSVLLPIGYFACLYWFTPWAGKDTGIREMFLVPYVPAACAGLIVLVLPRLLIHRTTKHWEMMGSQKKNGSLRLGWLCVILALIPMHGMTFPMFRDLSENMLYAALGCCVIPSLLWLIIHGLRVRFSRQPYQRVMHALRRTILLPCSGASLVVLFCAIFALQSMETYWVKKDTLLKFSPDAMAGGFEARVMKALDREQRQALGIEQD